MSVKSLLIRNSRFASWFMSSRSAEFWRKSGEKSALKMFRRTVDSVSAYQRFLKDHHFDPEKVQSIADLKKLPIIDKHSYIYKFDLKDLVPNGHLEKNYLIDRSSGFSGTPYFWPRPPEEHRDYPSYMRLAYEQFYQIDQKSTLMIITLALSTWVGGEEISWATRQIALSGKNPFTVITPGQNLEEVLEIVAFFKGRYQQIVLVGYPPFIKEIIEEGIRRGINWPEVNVKIGLGGEGYSENWREYIREKIGLAENDLMGIAGGYGAADLGMSVGREYPISVLIRKLANNDRRLCENLFGRRTIPTLCQYVPSNFYIEQSDGELIFSCAPGIPLIRYNIHDRGGVIPFEEIIDRVRSFGDDPFKLLRERGYNEEKVWKLPFFFVYGRSDGTVVVDGSNVYPENIDPIFYSQKGHLLASFKIGLESSDNYDRRLIIYLQFKEGIDLPDEAGLNVLRQYFHDYIVEKLRMNNIEYKDTLMRNPKVADPKVEIAAFGEGVFKNEAGRIKRDYTADN